MIAAFAKTIRVRTFPSGQKRTVRDPPLSVLTNALDHLGTYSDVADAFGVSRSVVQRWMAKYQLDIPSRNEIKLANEMRMLVSNRDDQDLVAQWLMDEGSVSVGYFIRSDYTVLIVCGSMNDYAVLARISSILGVPITSSSLPSDATLPTGAVRVQGPKGYALLQTILPRLVGLKALEAQAALDFFPSTGRIKGRHTTDEFLVPVWERFAADTLSGWNSRRRVKTGQEEIERLAAAWVEGRIRRARRFVDAQVPIMRTSQKDKSS